MLFVERWAGLNGKVNLSRVYTPGECSDCPTRAFMG